MSHFKINNLTLVFADRETESQYQQQKNLKDHHIHRVAAAVGAIIYVALKWVIHPDLSNFSDSSEYEFWRLLGTFVFVGTALVTWIPFSPKVRTWVASVVFVLMAVVICKLLYGDGSIAQRNPAHFGVGVNFIIAFYMLSRLSTYKSFLVSGIGSIIFAYFLWPIFQNDSAVLLSQLCVTHLITFTIAFMFERSQRTSFMYEIRAKQEHDKADRLLLNILPATIATRLKNSSDVIADSFDSVTVCFADIVGYTTMSKNRSAESVVSILRELYSLIDAACVAHGCEKIKTMGDAYMVAAGLPEKSNDHATRICQFAKEILSIIEHFNESHGTDLSFRVGIHTGPAVAGVIGTTKFAYDIWGDTVNIASRMESTCEPGRIQITESTSRELGPGFSCSPRGEVNIKGIGLLETKFLDVSDDKVAA